MDESRKRPSRPTARTYAASGHSTPEAEAELAARDAVIEELRDRIELLQAQLRRFTAIEERERSGPWTALIGLALALAGIIVLFQALDLTTRSVLLPLAAFLVGAGVRLAGSDQLNPFGNKLLGRRPPSPLREPDYR
ncbi:MAG TPA: hypothetical protein VFR28_10300 [Allosphingosinicella sp.]|jgi:hypothetical protein|nr:hypothetical protein [Allosphingosinicella sp.]